MAVFKARARALEMLGRQQIANIPTAISELFKNAHDAYADRVEVDYYRPDRLFVLRDDGLGMNKREFEDRWLTIGTESRVNSEKGLTPIPKDPDKPERPILGEKGIGRLAIATIGNQVLVLTRGKRDNEKNELVVAFIHWGFFSLPGVDLDQIIIPLETFPNGRMPAEQDIIRMVEGVRSNLSDMEKEGVVSSEDAKTINEDLDLFIRTPPKIEGYPENLNLSGMRHGTHFIIYPTSESVETAIDADIDSEGNDPPILKMLLGFTNTMVPGASPPVIQTSFRDHKSDDNCDDLINDKLFFTPEDFERADHHIQGDVDSFGQFKGTVSVYGKKYPNHVIPWMGAKGKETDCGPFHMNIAYIQGNQRESRLAPDEWFAIGQKLNRIGGIYIYKDGIRILPYGDTGNDFLNIEFRRSKSASYYYFSYRRIFGAFEISKKNNAKLVEKAGREGFIINKAFGQFKEIAESIFIQLAHDFFREDGGPNSEFWDDYRKTLQRNYRIQQENERRVRVKKKKIVDELTDFFLRIVREEPQKEIAVLLNNADVSYKEIRTISDPNSASILFLNNEALLRRELDFIRKKYLIVKPRGVGLSKQTQFDWQAYQREYENLEIKLFSPAAQKLNNLSNTIEKQLASVDRRSRFEMAIEQTKAEAQKATSSEVRDIRNSLEDLRKEVTQVTKNVLSEMDNEINIVMSEIASIDIVGMGDSEFVSKRSELEERLLAKSAQETETLEKIHDQLENIRKSVTGSGEIITDLDIKEALEEENFALRERTDLDLELSQLGTAISIIQHEFQGTITSINKNLRKMKAWADVNEDLEKIYNSVRYNFEHLEGYLTLFRPLNRRMYRKQIIIRGETIADFIKDLFSERVRRHNISLEFTKAFIRSEVVNYPSSLFPVFINIVDNAIYWLKDNPIPRRIVLDADDQGYIVSNNGPQISDRDKEIIFEPGFSRKENGRGLGLYISKQVLLKIGYGIYVSSPQPGMNVTFRIDVNNTELGETEPIHA